MRIRRRATILDGGAAAMSDPISPPAARRPEEALELVSAALSDGDLEAALAQYERGAILLPWAAGARREGDSLRDTLARLMDLRLPLSATVHAVLATGDLALVLGERQITGTSAGAGPEPVRLTGLGSTVLRRQPDGTWCIVADAWRLGAAGPAPRRQHPRTAPPAPPPPCSSPGAPSDPPRAGSEPGWRTADGGATAGFQRGPGNER